MKKGRLLAVLIAFALVAAMLPGTALAQAPDVVWVNADWDGLISPDVEDPFGNPLTLFENAFYQIYEAIEEVAEGGTIYVMPGVYNNEYNDVPGEYCILNVNKSLTIQGVKADGTPINDSDDPDIPQVFGSENLPSLEGDPSYIVSADDVQIFGLHFYPDPNATEVFTVFHVTGNNFFLKNCTIDTNGSNEFSVMITGAAAEKALIGLNNLTGGILVGDGAGNDEININTNQIIHSGQMGAIFIGNAYAPKVINNEILLDPNYVDHSYQLVALSDDDANEYRFWILDTLSTNNFESAYAVITDLATNNMPLVDDAVVAYATFEKAAEDAETGDTIVIFHPSVEHGVTFDSSLVPDDGQVAFAHHIVAFLPKASLPGDNNYTVTMTLNPPSAAPADAPEGYEIVGVMTAIIEADGTPFSEFEGPVTFWISLPEEVEDPEKAAFFWYDEEAEEWVLLEGIYEGEMLIVELDHWSDFALMEGEGTQDGDEEPILPETGKSIPWLIPLGLLLLLAGAVLIRRKAVA